MEFIALEVRKSTVQFLNYFHLTCHLQSKTSYAKNKRTPSDQDSNDVCLWGNKFCPARSVPVFLRVFQILTIASHCSRRVGRIITKQYWKVLLPQTWVYFRWKAPASYLLGLAVHKYFNLHNSTQIFCTFHSFIDFAGVIILGAIFTAYFSVFAHDFSKNLCYITNRSENHLKIHLYYGNECNFAHFSDDLIYLQPLIDFFFLFARSHLHAKWRRLSLNETNLSCRHSNKVLARRK